MAQVGQGVVWCLQVDRQLIGRRKLRNDAGILRVALEKTESIAVEVLEDFSKCWIHIVQNHFMELREIQHSRIVPSLAAKRNCYESNVQPFEVRCEGEHVPQIIHGNLAVGKLDAHDFAPKGRKEAAEGVEQLGVVECDVSDGKLGDFPG